RHKRGCGSRGRAQAPRAGPVAGCPRATGRECARARAAEPDDVQGEARRRRAGGAGAHVVHRRSALAPPLPVQVLGAVSPVPAAALLAGLAVAALLADRPESVAVIVVVLLVVCLRAPADRRRMYLVGAFVSGVALAVVTPFVATIGSHPIWTGPTVPVLGQLDVTTEELHNGIFQGLRLVAVSLAFAAYALLLDHDRLVQAA